MIEKRDEYYSRDEDGRFEAHETEAAARRDAEEILDNCQESAGDNRWPEGTGDVEWGRLIPLGECVASNERESDRSDFDYLVDYNLKDLPDPTAELRSSLESVTRERDAALRRVGELELAANHAMEMHERWCNCDVEELSNAMTVLDQVLHEEPSDGTSEFHERTP